MPDLTCFERFQTMGPSRAVDADINDRAAAVECYLDLGRSSRPAVIEWGGFNGDVCRYQGALLGKTANMDDFLSHEGA